MQPVSATTGRDGHLQDLHEEIVWVEAPASGQDANSSLRCDNTDRYRANLSKGAFSLTGSGLKFVTPGVLEILAAGLMSITV